MSGYNVGETFESDNWDIEHHCCWTYRISNIRKKIYPTFQ